MPETLHRLHDDHVIMNRLLHALDRQLGVFESGETPDYELIGGILDYCLRFPDRYHHPKENAILERIQATAPEAAEALCVIEAEHAELTTLTKQLTEIVGQVLQDQEIPRHLFGEAGRAFSNLYRRHIDWEESHFLPQAEALLSDADWRAVDQAFATAPDPLGPDATKERYTRLREDLLRFEADQVACRWASRRRHARRLREEKADAAKCPVKRTSPNDDCDARLRFRAER